jgi:magnesium transporter
LHKRDLKLIHDQLQKYFGDIYENAVKITETFDTYRDLMANLREAYQSSLANRANEIMRVFTALTTIFMPLTFITGLYGMNFKNLPIKDLPGGEYIVMGGMLVLGVGMLWYFRIKEWI